MIGCRVEKHPCAPCHNTSPYPRISLHWTRVSWWATLTLCINAHQRTNVKRCGIATRLPMLKFSMLWRCHMRTLQRGDSRQTSQKLFVFLAQCRAKRLLRIEAGNSWAPERATEQAATRSYISMPESARANDAPIVPRASTNGQ